MCYTLSDTRNEEQRNNVRDKLPGWFAFRTKKAKGILLLHSESTSIKNNVCTYIKQRVSNFQHTNFHGAKTDNTNKIFLKITTFK